MSYDPVQAQKRYVGFKRTLTMRLNAARKQNDAPAWENVSRACGEFFKYYADSAEPMPDQWHAWERAEDDAIMALRRLGKW